MTNEDIGTHLHYDEQVATETYVLRNFRHLLTDAERTTLDDGLEAWWSENLERMHEWGARARKLLPSLPPWEPAPFDQAHAEQVKKIVARLRTTHGSAIAIPRCVKCDRIGRGPDDTQCPWCLAPVPARHA